MPDRYDRLEKLKKLLDDEAITYDEYLAEKARILESQEVVDAVDSGSYQPWGVEPNMFGMLLHLSQLTNFIAPPIGVVLPIVMWVAEKDRSRSIDLHGRVVLNWMISSFLYAIASIPLMFAGVGFLTLGLVLLLGVIFPIIGSLKANQGIVWIYPLSIPFFPVRDQRSDDEF